MCQGWDGAGRADDLGEMKWQTACSPGLGPKGRGDLREVAAEFQLAAAGPVEAVEGSLHQGRHDAAQAGLICTAVPLTVMLHAEPRGLTEGSAESWPGSPLLGRQAGGPAMGDPALTMLQATSWTQFPHHAVQKATPLGESQGPTLCRSGVGLILP